ncbi:MAG: GNAT family N-acetyltransferase [Promethearchaeota archaeon]
MESLQIRECTKEDMVEFTEIMSTAFEGEFSAIFKGIPREVYLNILSDTFSSVVEHVPEHGFFIAKAGDQTIGILNIRRRGIYRHSGWKLWKTMRKTLGFWKSIKHLFFFRMFDEKIRDDALHIGAIGVQEDYRSHGFGSILLHFAEEFARGFDHDTIKLEVVDGNARALRLYRRTGFQVEKKVNPLLAKYLFDVPGYYRMVKHVSTHVVNPAR